MPLRWIKRMLKATKDLPGGEEEIAAIEAGCFLTAFGMTLKGRTRICFSFPISAWT